MPRPPKASSPCTRSSERYYYEIPKSELGKEFLWNSQIAKTAIGVGYGGGQLTDRVVRWELQGQSRAAAGGQLQRRRRPQVAHRDGREERQQRRDHHGVHGRGLRQGRRPGDRRDPAVHQPTYRNSARASSSAPPGWMPRAPSSSTSTPFPENMEAEVTDDLHQRRRPGRRGRAADAAAGWAAAPCAATAPPWCCITAW